MKEGLSQLLTRIKDIIFPVFCLSCDKEGAWVCDACRRTLSLDPQWQCPVCHKNQQSGIPCSETCRADSALDAVAALLPFREDSLIGSMIHAFKYQYAEELAELFQPMFEHFFGTYSWYAADMTHIVPVPLHRRRYAERGFNQAELLAHGIAVILNRPCVLSLNRHRATQQQALLGRVERITNVRDAFSATADVRGISVLLIDDVYTTGSTMQACARALKEAGALRVRGLAVGRG